MSFPSSVRTSQARRPRGIVRVDGVPITFKSFEVMNKSHFSADTWRVEIEPWSQPENLGFDFWADIGPGVQIEILMGFLASQADVAGAPAGPVSLIVGQVDDIEPELLSGKLAISGRDLSALLIDTKTSNKYPDHTSSDIVTQLAQQVGLSTNVTPTTTPAGQFADNAYASLSRSIPMWDIIVFLAQQEGFDAYVTGSTLYFGPPQAETDASPFSIFVGRDTAGRVQSNARVLKLPRSLTLAQDISVTVLSHGVASAEVVKATATRAGKFAVRSSASKAAQTEQSYVIRKPNLSQEQAQLLANSLLADITSHERVMEATMEGDESLSVRRQAKISGTGTSFDTSYFIDRITRTYSVSGGFDMTIHGKNHETLSEIPL